MESTNQYICQCCGMPLGEETFSKEPDGSVNKEYCKWCYADGKFRYSSIEQLMDFIVPHMTNENYSEDQVREYFGKLLPQLKHWKQK